MTAKPQRTMSPRPCSRIWEQELRVHTTELADNINMPVAWDEAIENGGACS